MAEVRLICVGKMREKHYISAFEEYSRRLGAYCRFELTEIDEQRLGDNPSPAEIRAALDREADAVLAAVPKGAYVTALCIEGREMSSEELAASVASREASGRPKMCFIVGGSYGLSDKVKSASDLRLSMSKMTFPHHLARVMLAEQIYRAFKINEGSKYHK